MTGRDDYQRAILWHRVLRWTLAVVVTLSIASFIGWGLTVALTDRPGIVFLAKGIVMVPFAASLVVALRVINFWRQHVTPFDLDDQPDTSDTGRHRRVVGTRHVGDDR